MTDDASLLVKLDIHPEDLAEKVARGLVRFYREPENLAALSGGVLLPLVVFRGRKVPFLPVFVVAMMGVQGGKMAYRASENLRVIAQAASGQIPEVSRTEPELQFHGPDCPGHTTGMPGASCLTGDA